MHQTSNSFMKHQAYNNQKAQFLLWWIFQMCCVNNVHQNSNSFMKHQAYNNQKAQFLLWWIFQMCCVNLQSLIQSHNYDWSTMFLLGSREEHYTAAMVKHFELISRGSYVQVFRQKKRKKKNKKKIQTQYYICRIPDCIIHIFADTKELTDL